MTGRNSPFSSSDAIRFGERFDPFPAQGAPSNDGYVRLDTVRGFVRGTIWKDHFVRRLQRFRVVVLNS